MQKKIDILTDLIGKSLLKPSQKKIAFDIISDVVAKYNLINGKYQNRIKNDHEIKSDFVDYYDRVYTLLYIMGVNEIDIFSVNYKYTEWLEKHLSEFKKKLNYDAIYQMSVYLETFEACYERLPNDIKEFKDFILEPLEITESDFGKAYKNAIIKFSKDHIMTDIIKVGWAKEIMGKIKKA